jgi:hypothetical protein
MTNYYQPQKITEEYINSKNIIKLCFNKKLYDNNILNNILTYINKYATGFALFDDIFYKTSSNKKLYHNEGGHPFELILRILYELKDIINSKNNIFNEFIKHIHNTYNYNKININECLLYINNKFPRIIKEYLSKPADFIELLYVIDQYIYKNKINKLTSTYTKTVVCNNCNNKLDSELIIATNDIYPLNISLLHFIKKESNFIECNNSMGRCNKCRSNDIYYKKIINCKKIINFNFKRVDFNKNGKVEILSYPIDISETLTLPFFVCDTNKLTIYNLKFIICYIDDQYSIIIKKDCLWYHYHKDYIIKVTFNYILENSINITGLIYILNI